MMQAGIPAKPPTQQMPQQHSAGQSANQWATRPIGAPAEAQQFAPQGGQQQPQANRGFGSRDLFTVPSDRVGLLIGKGGSKIREIQEVSGARMDIAKLSHPETPEIRNVTLLGTKEQVTLARSMIDALVNESASFRPGIHSPPLNPTKTFQIPSATVGLVIGKGGDSIKKIIQESSCAIHIEKEAEAQKAGRTPPQPGYQNVYLKGTNEAVAKAEAAILELVHGDQRFRKPQTMPYAQFGQFVIPQYQQLYGVPTYGAQQLYGLQQPYTVAGQQLIQPTYAVMPGYPTAQQYANQFMAAPTYNTGAVGMTPQYAAYAAQYQAAAAQMGIPQYIQASTPLQQQPVAIVSPNSNQDGLPSEQLKTAQLTQQLAPIQSHTGYGPPGGGPIAATKPLSTSTNHAAATSTTKPSPVLVYSHQIGQMVGGQNPAVTVGGEQLSIQTPQAAGHNNSGVATATIQSAPSTSYNGILTNAYQQQLGGAQSLSAPAPKVIYHPQVGGTGGTTG